MSEEPEDVLPQERRAAVLHVEEVRPQIAVQQHHRQPAVSGGMAKTMSTEVQSIVHTKKGTFHRAMPGARSRGWWR